MTGSTRATQRLSLGWPSLCPSGEASTALEVLDVGNPLRKMSAGCYLFHQEMNYEGVYLPVGVELRGFCHQEAEAGVEVEARARNFLFREGVQQLGFQDGE